MTVVECWQSCSASKMSFRCFSCVKNDHQLSQAFQNVPRLAAFKTLHCCFRTIKSSWIPLETRWNQSPKCNSSENRRGFVAWRNTSFSTVVGRCKGELQSYRLLGSGWSWVDSHFLSGGRGIARTKGLERRQSSDLYSKDWRTKNLSSRCSWI